MSKAQSQSIMEMSDRISPILVKELRQGLRAKSFLGIFLVIQLGMALILISSISSYSHLGYIDEETTVFFWGALFLSLILVMPLLGIGALASERKESCLEILQITHLQSFGIILGKWISLGSQIGLIVFSVLPFMAIRYFFGGIDLAIEGLYILTLGIASLIFTGITISISSVRSKLARGFLTGLYVVLAIVSAQMMTVATIGFHGSHAYTLTDLVWVLAGLCTIGLPTLFIAMRLAAQSFAAAAENHETIPRLLFVAILLVCFFFALLLDEIGLILLSLPALYLVTLQGLMSYRRISPTSLQRFMRFGRLGKRSLFFLAPGWPSAIWFCSAAYLLLVSYFIYTDDTEGIALVLSAYATVLLPVTLCSIKCGFADASRFQLSAWLIANVASIVLFAFAAISGEAMHDGESVVKALAFIPLAALFMFSEWPELVSGFMMVEIMLCLVFMGVHSSRAIRQGWNRDEC